jgi:hypothetical protein
VSEHGRGPLCGDEQRGGTIASARPARITEERGECIVDARYRSTRLGDLSMG